MEDAKLVQRERIGIARFAAIGRNWVRLPEARQRARPCSNTGWRAPGPPCEGQLAETDVDNHQYGPSAFQRGEAERLLPVALALGECPERAQGPRQPRPGLDRKTKVFQSC